MYFGRFYILLLVLVFSLDFVRSEEDYDAAIDDDADEGVDDDAGVADDADGDLPAENDDAVADDDAVNDDAMTNVPVNGDIIEAESVDPYEGNDAADGMNDDDPNPAHPCVPGTHFKIECNYCYCHKPNVQSCTFIYCKGYDKTKKLSSNPAKRLAFKRLRDHATGCVPGETIKHENCECSCTIPSILTCPENCLR